MQKLSRTLLVSVPKGEEEAIRDLSRAREEAIGALQAAQSLCASACSPLHRPGHLAPGPSQMALGRARCHTGATHRFPSIRARGQRTPGATAASGASTPSTGQSVALPPRRRSLQALRGGPCLVAVTPVAALGDLPRCDKPRALLQCLGLIPSAYATGARRRQGAIPQAGQTPARRALVAGAWAYRSPAKGSRPLHRRREKHPKVIQDISWQAHGRLCTRSRRLRARGQQAHQVVVAMARALGGFCGPWPTRARDPVTASPHGG